MSSSWDTLDWRRRVTDLYRTVRDTPDPAAAHEIWVRERNVLLATHPASPVPAASRSAFGGADVRPYDPAYRFEVTPDLDVGPETREVATGTDGVVPFHRLARLVLDGLGELDVWWLGSYGGGLFLPVRDAAASTYGGGRYVLDTVKGADLGGDAGALVVDFNFAYQPSCAYDAAWACPLPGPTNTLAAELPVGEQFAG